MTLKRRGITLPSTQAPLVLGFDYKQRLVWNYYDGEINLMNSYVNV